MAEKHILEIKSEKAIIPNTPSRSSGKRITLLHHLVNSDLPESKIEMFNLEVETSPSKAIIIKIPPVAQHHGNYTPTLEQRHRRGHSVHDMVWNKFALLARCLVVSKGAKAFKS
jgi:hypothetical protein